MESLPRNVVFDPALIRKYDGRGPRYTSYPTALQFDPAFDESAYRRHAITSNQTDRALSLYVHIPFCESLCYYCACNKIVTRNQERVQKYLRHLKHEIDLVAPMYRRKRVVEQLHFGGGTPTYLDAPALQELMTWLRGAFSLDDSKCREFSIEVDPRTVDSARMVELSDLGFNRVSLGVQDFDLRVQKAVNRLQSADDVAALMDDARSNGFRSVSLDLIYGLPHQTVGSFDQTLDTVIGMRPDRLAVYNYAHLPQRFKGQRMINERDIPAADTKLDILRHTIETLVDAGYVYIGMDHFALPGDELVKAQNNGTLRRNFQGYSTHCGTDLVGLGVSAIGNVDNAYIQNTTSTTEYETLLDKGQLPVVRGLSVDEDDQARADIIRRLMCYDRLEFHDVEAAHGLSFRDRFASELKQLKTLEEDGLVAVDDQQIQVTPSGRLLLRSIAMVFDRHLASTANDSRFSKAI